MLHLSTRLSQNGYQMRKDSERHDEWLFEKKTGVVIAKLEQRIHQLRKPKLCIHNESQTMFSEIRVSLCQRPSGECKGLRGVVRRKKKKRMGRTGRS